MRKPPLVLNHIVRAYSLFNKLVYNGILDCEHVCVEVSVPQAGQISLM